MTEHDIQNNIRVELSKLGYTVFRINVGKFKMDDGRWFSTGVPPGFSDTFCVKNGMVSFIEIKSSTGKATKEQLNFIAQMQKQGCKAGVARSVEDVLKILE